ncbi:LMBR1-like membrane protein-domain-containing protein [Phyllosticta citricarpa]|uniref:LMBR1-like membrane protein-domain-containing protein n=1 Tax=Phyllosticta paracitricarpa TaxID=2016321 RepID=A0ABR1NL12_9PEZI
MASSIPITITAQRASSSAGSNAFFAVSLSIICLLVLLLLRYYLPLRKTPAYLLVPVFLALALPASIILLVPIDLGSVRGVNGEDEGGRGVWLPGRALLVCWRIGYWLTFALTWAILPLLGEYSDAGYLSPKSRFLYSLRSNGQYWAIVLGSSLLVAIYFFSSRGFHFTTFKSLVMALAYAWGLILAIYLMGHGLVSLPRRLWRTASITERLKRIQAHAPKVHEKFEDAIEKLADYEQQVMQLRNKRNSIPKEFQEWIEELVDSASLLEAQPSLRTNTRTNIPAVITEKFLADLTRHLKRARHAKLRFEDEWARLVSDAVFTQAILDASTNKRLESTAGTAFHRANFWSRLGRRILNPSLRYHLHAHIVPAFYYASATFLGLASVAVVWSEVTKSLSTKVNIISRTIVHHPSSTNGKIGFAGQCIAALWLCYMVLSALYSITEVKIWGNRALVRRQTYAESACWYACQVAKLTVPLAYNFITFFDQDIAKETIFYTFLGSLINLTPLGAGFSKFFPTLILIPVAAAMFGLYGKAKRIIGLGEYMEIGDEDDDEADDSLSGWREGRALIDRELHGNGLLPASTLGVGLRNSSPRNSSLNSSPSETPSRALSRSPVNHVAASAPTSATPPTWQSRSSLTPAAAASSRPMAPTTRAAERRAAPPPQYNDDEGDGESNWFGDFTHRVKNTLDTTDFGVPKWMKIDGRDEDGENALTRLFGGNRSGGGASGARGGGGVRLL